MTDQEIRVGILSICKIKGSDSDINITGFHALCDKLKELGAVAEREACALKCEHMGIEGYGTLAIGAAIRARGQA